jgi:hypothetical protein
LRGVVRPGGENLSALIQIVLPHFVEGVGLAVMSLGVFRHVLDAEEAGDANVVKGRMVGAKTAGHAGFKEF